MAAAPTWEVTNQVQTIGTGPDGRAVEGWKVFYKTAKGTVGSVFLPLTRYNAANVKAAIADQYAHIEAVHGLTSGT